MNFRTRVAVVSKICNVKWRWFDLRWWSNNLCLPPNNNVGCKWVTVATNDSRKWNNISWTTFGGFTLFTFKRIDSGFAYLVFAVSHMYTFGILKAVRRNNNLVMRTVLTSAFAIISDIIICLIMVLLFAILINSLCIDLRN